MKYLKLKFLLMFFALAMAIPPAWAGTVTTGFNLAGLSQPPISVTVSQTTATTTITGDSNETWNIVINTLPYSGMTGDVGNKYWQLGKKDYPINSATFSTSEINGTIKKIVVNCASYNALGSINATVDGNAFGTQNQSIPIWSNNQGGNVTFEGNASGEITITMASTSKSRAMYIQSITVTYEEGGDTPANPWIKVTPDPLNIDDDGGVFTVSCANMPDNGLGMSVDSSSPSNEFSFTKTNDNTFDDGDKYFPLTNHALENGTVKVNYTGHALSAAGVIKFASGSESTTADVKYLYDGDIYIVGDVEGSGWSTEGGTVHGVPLVKNADGTYSVTVTATAGGEGFSWLYFTKSLNASNYDNLGYNRFGPAGDYGSWSYNSGLNGVYCDLDTEGNLHTIKMSPGNYIFTIDPANNKFKIEEIAGPSEPVTYELVTDEAELAVGDNIILVGNKQSGDNPGYRAMGEQRESNFGITTEIEVNGNTITTASAQVLTLENNNGWNFKTSDGEYLYAASSSQNHLKTKTDIDDSARATIDIDSSGKAEIKFKSNNRNLLRYNPSSDIFSCYSSGQQPVYIYKEVNANKVATPTFSPAGGTYTEVQNVEINCTTEDATIYYTTDGTVPTTASAVYRTAIEVAQNMTIKAMAVKEGMTNSNVATAEYTINLPITVSTLAEANALEENGDDVSFTFTENKVVVTFNQSYETTNNNGTVTTHTLIGLRDKSENDKTDGTGKGGSVFFDISDEIANNLTQGTVLNPGWKAKTSDYSGWVQLKGASSVTTQDETVTVKPFDRTGVTLTAANQSEYIILNNVTINGTTATAGGSKATYTLFNRFNLEYGNGDYEYLIGVVNIHNNSIEIYPLEVKKAKVVTPTFNPGTGEYTTIQNVEITCATQGATISYKIGENGEWKTYTEPIEVAESCTITAKATKTGMLESDEASATYTINLPTLQAPTFDPEAGTYTQAQNVTISCATEGAAISYKIGEDGEWTPYTKAITVSESCTITAKATKKGFIDSPEASAQYVIKYPVAAPTFNPEAGTYTTIQNVEISCATEGATISYKIGEEGEWTPYSEAIEVAESCTIYAKAEKEGMTATEASAPYVINLPTLQAPTFDPKAGTYDEAQDVTISAAEGAAISYKIGENGEWTPYSEAIPVSENCTIYAKATKKGFIDSPEASAEYKFRQKATLSFGDQTEFTLTIGDNFTAPKLTGVPEGGKVTYESRNPNVATVDANGNVTIVGIGEAEITATFEGNDDYMPATASYTITVNDVVEALAAPTFAPAAGTYTEPKEVAIACATPGVTIEYTIDGVTKTYEGPFLVNRNCTVTATAKMGTRTVYTPATSSATYTINAAPAATIADDYYFLQSNAAEVSGKYANVAGRRTLNFVADADKQAGTVFRVMTDPDTIGQVETLRSQAVDLQGYANRAMAYVPKVIDLVLSTLANSSLGDPETPGTGILGENGLDLILNKFYEGFDYNLYVEEGTEGTYRIYGRTPSMQHVVDFYHENTAQVEEKLPMLEGYINQVLDKIRNKVGQAGMNEGAIPEFSLKTVRDSIAKKNGIALIDPVDNDSKMEFYRQVLNNKEYVWDFAYQTAMIYVDAIKQTGTYQNLPNEYKLYVEKMEKVRPDTKYYIIERGNELDYISENNGEIINNDPRTLWTLEPRTDFTVNIAGEQFGCPYAGGVGGYATTNYTDFAYTVPEGVTAYKVASVENGVASLQALSGVIPAQTPVLLMAKEAGDYVLTLSTEAGTKVTGNLLVGVDSLITRFQLKTPMVVSLFTLAQGVLGEQLYNQYVAQYEYLQLLYAGTVNNKYFWGLNSTDTEKCVYINENNEQDCVIRNLGNGEFVNDWAAPKTNKAFLLSETDQTITISTLKGDVNHDGEVDIKDVTDLIDRLLGDESHSCPYCSDVNSDNGVDIKDVTDLIDILLRSGADTHVDTPTPDPEGGDGN